VHVRVQMWCGALHQRYKPCLGFGMLRERELCCREFCCPPEDRG
jgi:hypothetical protein